MNSKINKVSNAVKWSIMTEFIVKFISPISSMILARLLSPSDFGIVATVTMIVSLADIFTEAGFQRYIIQHIFLDEIDENESICVAFWTNLGISVFLWLVIFCFSNSIAIVVGNFGMGKVIWIGALVLPLTSFSSIQMAVYKKRLNFKDISWIRILTKLVPLMIVVPLAYCGFSFWSLIIGNIISELISAVILTVRSTWKPTFFYSVNKLKKMLSFCIWSMGEAFSSWLISNIGIFIIGTMFSEYYLGIYKTSTTIVTQIISIVTASTIGVLISALSNVQNDLKQYNKIYFTFLRWIGMIVIPLGIGMLLYSNLICTILLGNKWHDGAIVIGVWGFILSESVIFNSMSGAVIISKGKPKELFLANISQAIIMIPAFYYGSRFSFEKMVIISSVVRIELSIVQTLIACKLSDISISTIFKVIKKYIISTAVMAIFSVVWFVKKDSNIFQIISVLICIIIYFLVLYILPDGRKELQELMKYIKIKIFYKKK